MTLSEYLNHLEEKIKISCTVNTEEVAFRQDVEVLLNLVHTLVEQRNREINSDVIKMTVEQTARHLEVAKLQVERDDRQLEYYIPKGGE